MYLDSRTKIVQKEVVAALMEIGCTIRILSPATSNYSHLLIGYHGHNYFFEVHHPEDSLEFSNSGLPCANWNGSYDIITTPDEALTTVKMRSRNADHDFITNPDNDFSGIDNTRKKGALI